MTDGTYKDQSGYDRNEMFALGAAAGALVATAVQEVIERSRKKTPLEQATARVSAVADESSKVVGDLTEQAGDYLSDLSEAGRKGARKRTKQARKQTANLKKAAVGALGAVSVGNVVEQALELTDATLNRKAAKKKAQKWWQTASEAAHEYVDAARDSVADADIAGKAHNIASTARERIEDASLADRAHDVVATVRDRLEDAHIAARARDVAATARERLEDAHLTDRARDVAATARERLEDAHLSDRARVVAATASSTIMDAAETARERLSDAELGPKAREYAGVAAETVKDYSVKAQKAARIGAERIGDSAVYVAESTAEGAKDLRKGVKKSVKRTKRRMTWGLRAFIVGLAVGLLSAPQSGQRTRDMIQGVVQDLLDLILPDDQFGGVATQ